MPGQDVDPRRQARLLTEEDMAEIKRMIAAVTGAGEGKNPAILLQDLTFKEAVGGIAAGTTFSFGTPHEMILERMAKVPLSFPSYATPELFLSSQLPIQPEIGSHVSLTFTPSWIAADAGGPTSYLLKKNGLTMLSATAPTVYTEPTFTLTGTTVEYQSFVSYAAGAVKKDSEGNIHPTGMIQAGTISSNTISIAGRRYGFYGADGIKTIPATAKEVRDLPGKLPLVEDGTTFTIFVPAGARRITFWYPNTCRDVSRVKYLEQGGADYKDLFLKTVLNVEGANGHTAAPYKGFTWVLAIASPTAMTFDVHL